MWTHFGKQIFANGEHCADAQSEDIAAIMVDTLNLGTMTERAAKGAVQRRRKNNAPMA
jgi:hypothetical protein